MSSPDDPWLRPPWDHDVRRIADVEPEDEPQRQVGDHWAAAGWDFLNDTPAAPAGPAHKPRRRGRLTVVLSGVVCLVVVVAIVGVLATREGSSSRSASSGTLSPAAPTVPSPSQPSAVRSPSGSTPPAIRGASSSGPPNVAGGVAAIDVLTTLLVKGRASQTGYDRGEFGQAWLDIDRNGCDTRNDVLRRDLTGASIRPGTHGCLVEAGSLADPYTGAIINFARGNDTVDIDHVVALSDAWQTGAFRWPLRKRAAFANDPMNLLAVDSSANRQKGDGDAATWLPAVKQSRCSYVARQISVKAKYQLWVTSAERDALRRILTGCPHQRAWRGGAPTISPIAVNQPHDSTASAPPNPGGVTEGGAVYYENCDAVRAAGVAPIRRGDPGYDSHLDRDGDGIACE